MEETELKWSDIHDKESNWLDSFVFQQRHGKLHVRAIDKVDLGRVVKNVDIEALHEVLENVAFCNIKVQDLENIPDDIMIKTFRIAQLIVEYLINLQNSMVRRIHKLTDHISQSENEIENLLEDNKLLADDNDLLRKELKQKRKSLATYEYIMTVHGAGDPSSALVNIPGTLKTVSLRNSQAAVCQTCGKTFSNKEFLKKHCFRRKHPMTVTDSENTNPNFAAIARSEVEIQKMKDAFEKTLREKDEAATFAIERAKLAEREIYQEQLARLREERHHQEQRVETHYKMLIADQRAQYDKKIYELETKLAAAEKLQQEHRTVEEELRTLREEFDSRFASLQGFQSEALLPLLEARDRRMIRDSSSESDVETPAPVTVPEQTQTVQVDTKLVEISLKNLIRLISRQRKAVEKEMINRCFTKMRLYSMWKALLDAQQNAEDSRLELFRQQSIKPKRIDFNVDGLDDAKPISDELVHKLTMKYLQAQHDGTITNEDRIGMEYAAALLEENAMIKDSKFVTQRQPLEYAPLANKPYVRSRFDHRQPDLLFGFGTAKETMTSEMDTLAEGLSKKSGLTDAEYSRLSGEFAKRQSQEFEPSTVKALLAVDILVKNLVTEYLPPVDDNEFLEDFPEMHYEENVRMSSRFSESDLEVPYRRSGSETIRILDDSSEGSDQSERIRRSEIIDVGSQSTSPYSSRENSEAAGNINQDTVTPPARKHALGRKTSSSSSIPRLLSLNRTIPQERPRRRPASTDGSSLLSSDDSEESNTSKSSYVSASSSEESDDFYQSDSKESNTNDTRSPTEATVPGATNENFSSEMNVSQRRRSSHPTSKIVKEVDVMTLEDFGEQDWDAMEAL